MNEYKLALENIINKNGINQLNSNDILMPKSPKVFLGGTCNNSKWRDVLISKLQIEYFNPVVDDWDDAAYQNELKERKSCKYVLYVITPKMTGVYSIAEVVDDSHKQPKKTLFCVLNKDGDDIFTEGQIKSLNKVKTMVKENGAHIFNTLSEVAIYLNSKGK